MKHYYGAPYSGRTRLGRPVAGLRAATPERALAQYPAVYRRTRQVCAWWIPGGGYAAFEGGAHADTPLGAVLVMDWNGEPAEASGGTVKRR